MSAKHVIGVGITLSDDGLGGPPQQQYLIGRQAITWREIAKDRDISHGELIIHAGNNYTFRGSIYKIELQPTESLALLHMQWLAIGKEFNHVLGAYQGHTGDSYWAEYLGPTPTIEAKHITYFTMCPGGPNMLLELGNSAKILPDGHGQRLRHKEILPVWDSWLTPVNQKRD